MLSVNSELVERLRYMDELHNKIYVVSGMSVERILEMFAAGYTLTPPDPPQSLSRFHRNGRRGK